MEERAPVESPMSRPTVDSSVPTARLAAPDSGRSGRPSNSPPAGDAPVHGLVVTYNPDVEIFARVVGAALPQVDSLIVIDNASAGATRTRIREILDRAAGSSAGRGKVVFIQNESNVGPSRALNFAIRSVQSQGRQLFLILDHDSIVQDGAVADLAHQLDRLRAHFRVGAVGAVNIELEAPQLEPDAFQGGSFRRSRFRIGESVHEVKLLMGSGVLVDSLVFDDVGLFDESYFIDAIDIEFCLRLRARGYRLFLVDSARVAHTRAKYESLQLGRLSLGFHKPSIDRQYYASRDSLRAANKYLRSEPSIALFLYLALIDEAFRTVLFYGDSPSRLVRMARGVVDALRS